MTNRKQRVELLRLSQQKDLGQADKDLVISYLNTTRPATESRHCRKRQELPAPESTSEYVATRLEPSSIFAAV
jgi:hypothetical protein